MINKIKSLSFNREIKPRNSNKSVSNRSGSDSLIIKNDKHKNDKNIKKNIEDVSLIKNRKVPSISLLETSGVNNLVMNLVLLGNIGDLQHIIEIWNDESLNIKDLLNVIRKCAIENGKKEITDFLEKNYHEFC